MYVTETKEGGKRCISMFKRERKKERESKYVMFHSEREQSTC